MPAPYANSVATMRDRRINAGRLADAVSALAIARHQLERALDVIRTTSDAQILDITERAADNLEIVVELIEHELRVYIEAVDA